MLSLDRTFPQFRKHSALTFHCINSCSLSPFLVSDNCGTETTILISWNVLLNLPNKVCMGHDCVKQFCADLRTLSFLGPSL